MEPEQKNKRIVDRSSAYPSISLDIAISELDKLNDALGAGPYNRESIAQAIGYKSLSGVSIRKVAALVHYGFLERTGSVYKLSELAKSIVFHTSETDKQNAIKIAAKSPKLYMALLEKFTGASLPSLLPNILIRDFKINKKVANSVAEDFKISMEFAGFLINGVIDENIASPSGFEVSPDKSRRENTQEYIKQETVYGQFETPKLPSGLSIMFPNSVKADFVLGEFSDEIKALEVKVNKVQQDKAKEKDDSADTGGTD